MKWKAYKRALTGSTETFLVLPREFAMNRNNGLRLFTKAWPPKREEKDENARPLTATLERPQVLDIRLLGKIDMSLMRKEFLSLTNLCGKVPASGIARCKARRKTAVFERRRPLSNLPVAAEKPPKPLKKPTDTTSEDSWEEESQLSAREAARKLKHKSRIRPPAIVTIKPKPEEINNNYKIRNSGESIKPVVPEPCTTCGRPDLPERFHSHPLAPLKPIRKLEPPKATVKSTVQKPMAMRYKSKAIPPPPKKIEPETKTPSPKSRGPRTLTCYICGREFGTASLPLHEPKCLQKWERENASLPAHLQKQPPIKPEGQMTKDEWNKHAWEASQAALIPCENCGRTFLPDRLMVHQRSCKVPQRGITKSIEALRNVNPTTNAAGPPTAQCSVCGKLFGTKSIKIHEPQCLKKWQMQNNRLPTDQKEPITPNKDQLALNKRIINDGGARKMPEEERPPSARRPPMFPCYLCGRLFGVSSIYIHEPQCLKKWRIENEKLPTNKRRPEPLKPDIKFTPSGGVDFVGTFNRIWDNHLTELRPCHKCGRTFFPDRIETHITACNGLGVKRKEKK